MRHPTYKHLEARLRLGAFSMGQWAQITAAALAATLFGAYLSPLPGDVTIFISILVAGLPVALAYGAMGLEFSVAEFAAAAWRYWRAPRRYLPGPGDAATGYLVRAGDALPGTVSSPQPHAKPGKVLWDL